MSNPYRVRPTRARVDPNISGYGINQKPWNPGPAQRLPNNEPNSPPQGPPLPPVANQTKQNDSWDWNVDNGNNGNDSWNWSVDQSEAQKNQHHQMQQHHQPPQPHQLSQTQPQKLPLQQPHQFSPQQQQQHQQQQVPQQQQFPPHNQFSSTYANQNQHITPSPGQENFYKNVNGNDSAGTNQHVPLGRETPRIAQPVKEPTPKQIGDPFSQINNLSHNQQFPITPPRPSSNTSSVYSGPIKQPQWPSEQHSQSLPYSPNQINSQKQVHQTQPPQAAPHQPASVNNYNWNNADHQNVPFNNWPNQTETPASTFWNESTSEKSEKRNEIIGNNFSHQIQQTSYLSQQRIPNAFPPNNATNSDPPKFYNPHELSQENSTHAHNWLSHNTLMSNHQWQKNNSENVTNVLPRQQSLPSNNTWSQGEEVNSLPAWQQAGAGNIPNSQWRQPKLQPGGSLEESTLSENNKNDWHPVPALPSHFNSSTTSTTSGSLANMSSSTEQLEDRKRSLTPTTSFPSFNEFQGQVLNPSQNSAENNATSNVESFNAPNNVDLDWGADTEWNTVSDLSSSVNNMNLNSNCKNVEITSSQNEEHATQSAGDWPHQPASGLKSDSLQILAPIQKIVESAAAVSQESSNVPHGNNSKSSENISQVNYDQWYNQNSRAQPENDFFGNNSEKQWPAEPSVENCENVQYPTEFVNLEVVAPESQERDFYGSRESINKETLDNDPGLRKTTPLKESTSRDFRQETNNLEVSSVPHVQKALQPEQTPDNYEFASNDRNTFLETGELTDSHSQDHESLQPTQDDENDEVPNDIPFLREVPGQSSSIDPRRNDPTGQEQYAQGVVGAMAPRMSDPRRNDPSGQERTKSVQSLQQPTRNGDLDAAERRNDPSGRERSLPPSQLSRNEPSGEEQPIIPSTIQTNQLESSVTREIPGRGNEPEEAISQSDSDFRQILGGASSNESVKNVSDDRGAASARVVTGSQQINNAPALNISQESSNDTRNKREEAVGAPIVETQGGTGPPNRRDSYEDGDDEGSGNSRDDSRDRRRESSPKSSRHSRYDYNRKYFDRERDYEEDYYYDRRRPGEYERGFADPREEMSGRDYPRGFRDEDRRHPNRDDLERDRDRERDRVPRNDLDRRPRIKDEDDRDGRRRLAGDDLRRDRSDPRIMDRENREFDPRYRSDQEYPDRGRERTGRSRRYPEYDTRDSRDTYRRDYYEDSYGRNSRPSSRSSYNDRDRDYYMRSTREMYPSYGYDSYPGYDYGPDYNKQRDYYAYLENLRRTNPVAYAEWYHKYYQSQQQISRGPTSTTYPEDRASVHSGRSSCDDRNSSDKRNLTDASLLEEQTVASSRLTPTKFSTAHTKGVFSIGALLQVQAAYPTDGERARIDFLKMDQLLQQDKTMRELRYYPGPLIKGVTHKKTIIEYCENKIKKAISNDEMIEVSSYVLLYELMIMLIQQNGNVVGVDIASLLLRNKEAYPYDINKSIRGNNRRESTVSQRSGASGGEKSATDTSQSNDYEENVKPQKTIEELTNEFRKTLLYGLVQEALEFAMAEGLWGHALFLASKLDKRTHASVMTRFANSLPPQDPLQTLYQLHSGRVPASVTCVSDPKWDDWRPHLAMIISNTSSNPEINRRSISNLGDTLAARGDIYAAHFCYILSQVDFGAYGSSNVKLVLIGANHHKPYSEFISTDAILLTEIYEYARKLSEPFTLTELQTFKFNMAVKMVDYGLVEKALLYIEQVAVNIANEPENYKSSFINDVYTLGDRLKYHDPVCKDSDDDVSNLLWLKNLSDIVEKCAKGEITQENNHLTSQTVESAAENAEVLQQQSTWNTPYNVDNNSSMLGNLKADSQGNWQTKSISATGLSVPYNHSTEQEVHYSNETASETQSQFPSYQDYWPSQQQSHQQSYDQPEYYSQSEWQKSTDQQETDNSELQNRWTYESEKSEEKPAEKESIAEQQQQQQPSQQQYQQPNISMGPSGGKQYDPLEELEKVEPSKLGATAKTTSETKKQSDKSAPKKSPNTSSGGGWFEGLISKFVPQPKNQMILPDDSNPSIVWDPKTGKWLNKDDEDGGSTAPLAPPPKMSDLPGFKPSPAPTTAPLIPPSSAPQPSLGNVVPTSNTPLPTGLSVADETINSSKMITGGGNMYKLSRSRNMRANYVDVMNPGGVKNNTSMGTTPAGPTPVGSPAMPMAASSPQLFIPAPVTDPNAPLDFLTPIPATASQTNENTQALSRWSSASSLSREVQSYTMRDPRLLQRDKGPMMYNPMDMKDRSQKNQARSRYPPR